MNKYDGKRLCPACFRTVTVKAGRYPNHNVRAYKPKAQARFPKCPASTRKVEHNGVIM